MSHQGKTEWTSGEYGAYGEYGLVTLRRQNKQRRLPLVSSDQGDCPKRTAAINEILRRNPKWRKWVKEGK